MKDRQLRIAIIGLDHWYWAMGSARAVALNPETELAAIVANDRDQAKATASVYGAEWWGIDSAPVLADPQIDAVVITGTTASHDELATQAAAAGKHILIGKPISRTLTGADRIIQAARSNDVRLVCFGAGPNPGDPVKALVDQDIIGEPYAVTSSVRAIVPLRAPGVAEPGWFVDATQAAGGAFIDHAIYAAAMLGMFFGSTVESVHAEMRKMVHKEWTVEDWGVAFLRYKNGAMGTVESTFGHTPYGINMMVVTGPKGEIERRGAQITMTTQGPPYNNPHTINRLPPNPFYRTIEDHRAPAIGNAAVAADMITEFVEVIRTGRETLNSPEAAREGLEVCLAAYKSVEIGAPVRLPLVGDVDVPAILARL